MRDIDKSTENMGFLPEKIVEHLSEIKHVWRTNHKNYRKTSVQLTAHTTLPSGREIPLLIGPAAVGKTALMRDLDAILVKRALARGRPVQGSGYTELHTAPVAGKIDVTSVYARILAHFLEPLIDYKVLYPENIKDGAPPLQIYRNARTTRAAMISSLDKATSHQGYAALFLDDASSWSLLLKATRALEAPFVFKEIGGVSKTKIVVSGGPEVASFMWTTDQHCVRFKPIWMPPYYISCEADVRAYCDFLFTFEGELGPECIVPGTLSENGYEVMKLCWGVPGITVDMVLAAVIISLMEHNKPLDWTTLKPYLEDNANASRQTVELGQQFFAAAQDPSRRDEYNALLAYFRRTRRSESKDDPNPPQASKERLRASGEAASDRSPTKNGNPLPSNWIADDLRSGSDESSKKGDDSASTNAARGSVARRKRKPVRTPLGGPSS